MGWMAPPYYGNKKSSFYEKKIVKYNKKIEKIKIKIQACEAALKR